MNFGKYLSVARMQKGFSQSRLARTVGCDHSFISRIEAGERNPSREMTETIADALELNSTERDSLMLAAGYAPPHLSENMIADPILLRLHKVMQVATAEDQQSVRLTLSLLSDGLEFDYRARIQPRVTNGNEL